MVEDLLLCDGFSQLEDPALRGLHQIVIGIRVLRSQLAEVVLGDALAILWSKRNVVLDPGYSRRWHRRQRPSAPQLGHRCA